MRKKRESGATGRIVWFGGYTSEKTSPPELMASGSTGKASEAPEEPSRCESLIAPVRRVV